MQVIKNFNLSRLKSIVEMHAKFQKVMLLYDENVSNLEIQNLFDSIKEICIFNKMDLNNLNELEIHNGYKLLIFCCTANSFLKINFNLSDFVNIFVPVGFEVLPFFITENFKTQRLTQNAELELSFRTENYIFLNAGVDLAIFYSYYFNYFFCCLNKILSNDELPNAANFNIEFVNQASALEFLQNDLEYKDLKMLKELKLDYKFLPFLDYYLLLAFLLAITAIKQKNLSLVDVYKTAKDNYVLLDNFYAKMHNDAFFQLIDLNFVNLKNILVSALKNLQKLELNDLPTQEKTFLLNKLKAYCKTSNECFAYIFLFNVFG